MNWVSKLFSKAGSSVIDSVGDIIDNVHTSKKEKIKAITNRLVQLDTVAANREEKMEKELTSRLKIDTKSGSWLSKNIRPLAVGYLTVVVTILAFITILMDLKENQLTALQMWVAFFTTLMVTAYGFYFGSRGIEKVQKLRGDKK